MSHAGSTHASRDRASRLYSHQLCSSRLESLAQSNNALSKSSEVEFKTLNPSSAPFSYPNRRPKNFVSGIFCCETVSTQRLVFRVRVHACTKKGFPRRQSRQRRQAQVDSRAPEEKGIEIGEIESRGGRPDSVKERRSSGGCNRERRKSCSMASLPSGTTTFTHLLALLAGVVIGNP